MSNRVAILRDGKLLQLGAPNELYERPATRFVAEFLDRSNFLAGKVEQTSGEGFVYRCGSSHFVQLGARARPEVGAPVLVALRPERIRLVEPGSQLVNILDGTIAEFSYLGTTFHLLVDTSVGRLAVTVPDLAPWRASGHRGRAHAELGSRWVDPCRRRLTSKKIEQGKPYMTRIQPFAEDRADLMGRMPA